MQIGILIFREIISSFSINGMIRIPKFIRFTCYHIHNSRKRYLNSLCYYTSSDTIFSRPTNFNLRSHFLRKTVPINNDYLHFSTVSDSTDIAFEKICGETLESLTDFFEELVESKKELEKADVSFSSGVLNVNLGKYGTYVINRQSPNKQIWLSSPISGPKRYDYVNRKHCWIYKHNSKSLHQLLEDELSNILEKKIDMSKCAHYKLN